MPQAHERSHREREKTKGRKQLYERILIICEGSKTEPNYFNEIRQFLRLAEVFIKVTNCPTGTTPLQVVLYLEEVLKKSNNFDRGYCVFDRDEHPEYANAIAKAAALRRKFKNDENKPIVIEAIYSNPCFELWILSHFDQRVTRHIERSEAFSKVKQCIPEYSKGFREVFSLTRERLGVAYDHAELMRAICKDRGTDNPMTGGGPGVHIRKVVTLTQPTSTPRNSRICLRAGFRWQACSPPRHEPW